MSSSTFIVSPSSRYSSVSTVESNKFRRLYSKQFVAYKYGSYGDFITLSIGCIFTIQNFFFCTDLSHNEDVPTIIHYIICLVVIGLPLYYLQILLGQYSQLGVLFFRHMSPIGHGVGYALIINSLVWCCNYGLLMGDFLMYLLACIDSEITWMKCPPNTEDRCWDSNSNCTKNCINENVSTSAYIYWKEIFMNNLDLEPTEVNLGYPIFARVVPLCISWTIIYVIVYMGINSYEKVVRLNLYIGSVFMVILLLACCVTNGSITGITLMFDRYFGSLIDVTAWTYTVHNTLQMLGLSRACHVALGGYMTAAMPSDILVVATGSLNLFMVYVASFINHASIGIIMVETHSDANQFQYIWKNGVEPHFTIIPHGFGFMAIPQLWCVLYFLICIFVVINNLVIQIDIMLRCIANAHTKFRVYQNYMLATVCLANAVIGTVLSSSQVFVLTEEIFHNVMMQVHIFDLLLFCIFTFWIYRVQRICDDVHFLRGAPPTTYWKIFWYMLPGSLGLCYIYLTYIDPRLTNDTYSVVHYISYFLFISPIPILMIYELLCYLKIHHLVGLFQPQERWGPPDPEERHLRHLFNPRQETRSRRRDDSCHHNCLYGNKQLKKVVEEENERRAAQPSELEDIPEVE